LPFAEIGNLSLNKVHQNNFVTISKLQKRNKWSLWC